jgi:alpha-1,2-mannosyltransferase
LLIAVYLASAGACCALAARANADFVDLHVYRTGAQALLHGGPLYAVRYRQLPFTYPPFAAAAFALVAIVPWQLAASLVLLAGVVGTPAMFYFALRLRPVARWFSRADALRLAFAVSALAVWLEPIRSTLGFGQVNLILAVLVLADLALPDDSPVKGLAIGIAAGIKLTPLIFAVYLLAARRYRAAGRSAVVFAATVGIGYLAAPHASAYFYGQLNFARPGRISPVYNDWNQSLLGAVSRDLGRQPGPPWLAVVAVVGLAGVFLAALAGRRGDDAAGFGLCAVTGLLVSPISWTHHWTIALPGLLLAGLIAWRARREFPRRSAAWLTGIAALALIGLAGLARREPRMPMPMQLHLTPFWLAVSQVYVAAGLAVLAMAAGPQLSRLIFGRRYGRHRLLALRELDEDLAGTGTRRSVLPAVRHRAPGHQQGVRPVAEADRFEPAPYQGNR